MPWTLKWKFSHRLELFFIICFTVQYINSMYIAHFVYMHVIPCYMPLNFVVNMLFSCSLVQSSETVLASVAGLNNQYQGRLSTKRKVYELKLPAIWTGHGTFKKESESLPALHVSYRIILKCFECTQVYSKVEYGYEYRVCSCLFLHL